MPRLLMEQVQMQRMQGHRGGNDVAASAQLPSQLRPATSASALTGRAADLQPAAQHGTAGTATSALFDAESDAECVVQVAGLAARCT